MERSRHLMVVMTLAGAWALAACQMPASQSQSGASGPAQTVTAGPARPAAAGPTAGLPSGTIVAYYGKEVPAGWVLCDGRALLDGRRTPDLRNRFIMGIDPAAGTPIGEVGGSTGHRHDAVTGRPREKDERTESGGDHAANDGHTHEVTVQPSNHLPPYVKLVYIMKD